MKGCLPSTTFNYSIQQAIAELEKKEYFMRDGKVRDLLKK